MTPEQHRGQRGTDAHMHWILWTLLFFQQGHPEDSTPGDSHRRSLDSNQRDIIDREGAIDFVRSKQHGASAETARRTLAARQEQQFLDHYNRLMKAMLQFAESYNDRRVIDVKLLQAVKRALVDLQKHDALFRDASKQ